ncbi:poly rna polymerase cid11 [Ophiostoma piceae UAMH 11346]|uniref:polynucleotide adenylyltransferase n=1 Tax=Ophiostoma piceae (strain UAMH 11346) TaxID=1262450 RepID=S3C6G5_OPHP1|nr:poly rna polymerase cid11 [Ophiostoma piceae UAMH 11346]
MDSRPTTTESKHNFQSTPWSGLSPSASSPLLPTSIPLPETPVSPAAAASHLFPILIPNHHALFQAQLINYNKLISPSRGGGVGLQAQPLPPLLSAPVVQASAPRSRSSSKSHHNGHSHSHTSPQQQQQASPPQSHSHQNCHGNKSNKNADKSDRSVTKMGKDTTAQKSASPKQAQQAQQGQQSQKGQKGQQSQQSLQPSNQPSQFGHTDDLASKSGKSSRSSQASQSAQAGKTDQASQSQGKATNQSNQPSQKLQSSSSGQSVSQQNPQTTQTASSDRLTARPATSSLSLRQQSQRPSKSPRPQNKSPAAQASSVPSTPHQHARNFSFESREPSPNTTQNHSPRSAYSETNAALPSLRPLPPRIGNCIYETAAIRSRRRMPYSLGTDRLDDVPLDKVKAKLSDEDEKKLTADIKELYSKLQPSDKTNKKRERFVNKLQLIFNEEWPGHDIRVHIFGSSGNMLCSDDSDVDICITTNWKELENVCMIAEVLANRGMEKVVCVSSAKVPIVKIWDPELSLACDINVNNTPALENTRMILTYVSIDERVRPLAMLIKYWTRRRIINDAAFGATLSSYTWICMVLCFLQLRDIPVLPSIHQRPQDKLPRPDGTESEFADDMSKLKGFGDANTESLGELLFYFFRFYAYEFDYSKYVLSVRLGKLTTKAEKRWHTAINNMLCVEEPFNTARNLANTADDTSFRGLHMELRRAFASMSGADLEECCEQYVFPKEEERTVFQKPSQSSRAVLLRSSSQQQSGNRGGGRGGGNYRGNRPYKSGNNTDRSRTNSFDSPPLTAPVRSDMYMYTLPPMPTPYYTIPGGGFSTLPSSPSTSAAPSEFRRSLHRNGPTSDASSPTATLRSQSQPASRPSITGSQSHGSLLGAAQLNGAGPTSYARMGSVHSYPRDDGTDSDADVTPTQAVSDYNSEEGNSQYIGYYEAGSVPDLNNISSSLSSSGAMSEVPTFADLGPPSTSAPSNNAGTSNGNVGNSHSTPKSGIGSFSSRRRLSADQSPQNILDRRMQRQSQSRSPSPLDHSRANHSSSSIGVSSGNSSSATLAPSPYLPVASRSPLIVNGSAINAASPSGSMQGGMNFPSAGHMPTSDNVISEDSANSSLLNSSYTSHGLGITSASMASLNGLDTLQMQMSMAAPSVPTSSTGQGPPVMTPPAVEFTALPVVQSSPVIVNGSTSATLSSPSHGYGHPSNQASPVAPLGAQSFNQRMAARTNNYASVPYAAIASHGLVNGNIPQVPSPRQRSNMSRQQPSPLDLGMSDPSMSGSDSQHLSPVYENRTPSPTNLRKLDYQSQTQTPAQALVHTQSGSSHGRTTSNNVADKHATPAPASAPNPSGAHNKSSHKEKPAKGSNTNKNASGDGSNTAHHNHHRANGSSVSGAGHGHNHHVRGAKSESAGEHGANAGPNSNGGWQKPKSRKKAADLKAMANGHNNHGEQLPRNDSERKGG